MRCLEVTTTDLSSRHLKVVSCWGGDICHRARLLLLLAVDEGRPFSTIFAVSTHCKTKK